MSLSPRLSRILVFSGLAATLPGCSSPPPQVEWTDGESLIAPGPPTSTGKLVVETAETGISDESGRVPHAPYYVYDSRGNYVDDYPNDHLTPVSLPIGRYAVVTRIAGEYLKVQVLIKENLTTYVLQTDFRARVPAK